MSGSYSISTRLIAFSIAIVGMASLVAWAAKTSWDQLEALHERIQEESVGSFRIADEFQASIYRLNYTLLRFGTRETSAELERFQRESKELQTWLDQQKELHTTPREQAVLDQINHAYNTYLVAAAKVIALAQQSDNQRPMFGALETVAEASQPLLELGSALVLANHEAHQIWREDFRRSVGQLQVVIFGSLFCLLALGAGTSFFVYRQLVAPLRTQLAESRELVARQEKTRLPRRTGCRCRARNPQSAYRDQSESVHVARRTGWGGARRRRRRSYRWRDQPAGANRERLSAFCSSYRAGAGDLECLCPGLGGPRAYAERVCDGRNRP